MRFSVFLAIILFFFTNLASAQPECRSMLGAHLTPIKKVPQLSWAIEETFAHGRMTDRNISNNLLFFGLDYSKKSHNIYFEGGAKMWRNSLGKYGQNSQQIPINNFPYKSSP